MAESVEPKERGAAPENESRSPARVWLSRIVDAALWLSVAGVLVLALAPKNSGPSVGTSAASHELAVVSATDGAAKTQAIPGRLERPLLIEAFASWCGACRRSSGILADLKAARDSGTLDVVAVSVDDSPEEALMAKNEWPIEVEVLHDSTGRFARDYRVDVLPTYILVGVDGRVKRVTAGAPGASDIRAWLREARE